MYNKVFDLNLRATTFLLYAYLLCSAGSKGYCWPSLETISRKTGLSVSTIQDHLKILERRKLIRKSKNGGQNWNKNNVYTLLDLENPEVYRNLTEPEELPMS